MLQFLTSFCVDVFLVRFGFGRKVSVSFMRTHTHGKKLAARPIYVYAKQMRSTASKKWIIYPITVPSLTAITVNLSRRKNISPLAIPGTLSGKQLNAIITPETSNAIKKCLSARCDCKVYGFCFCGRKSLSLRHYSLSQRRHRAHQPIALSFR